MGWVSCHPHDIVSRKLIIFRFPCANKEAILFLKALFHMSVTYIAIITVQKSVELCLHHNSHSPQRILSQRVTPLQLLSAYLYLLLSLQQLHIEYGVPNSC